MRTAVSKMPDHISVVFSLKLFMIAYLINKLKDGAAMDFFYLF